MSAATVLSEVSIADEHVRAFSGRGQVHSAELFTFQGDQITEMHHHFDPMELTRGLGTGPP